MKSKFSDEGLAEARQCARQMFERDACCKALGITIDIPATGTAVATMVVRPDMVNGFNVCHGGMVFTLADTAFAYACNAYNRVNLSVSATMEWLRPSHVADVLVARATEQERDQRHGFYTVRVHNQDEQLVAVFHGHSIAQQRALLE
ncbi:MAG TPA: hydroxyphenylacetyl-CoA thioesterase PaaI [Woeseiaceae bacterium]|nr:hydroxyphenylacetyl-CoA thioesterase PaaI [Woeseiaceae bacterium]